MIERSEPEGCAWHGAQKGDEAPGTLTEGTRHQGDKGAGLEHQAKSTRESRSPARARLVEVIGAMIVTSASEAP